MNDFFTVKSFSMDCLSGLDDGFFKNSEMTKDQLEFLCGLVRDFQPKKIVEVGVAEGATTSILFRCLDKLGLNAEVFSVDLNNQLYYDKSKQTGFFAKEYLEKNQTGVKHQMLLGKYLPEWLDHIGGDIDFVILDTVHHLPGEILDFLAVLPYLKDEAIVVLHDVALQHAIAEKDTTCFVNQILFTTACAHKFLNNDESYPNIAAFKVDADTRCRVQDFFSALTITWYYIPGDEELELYRNFYKRHYSEKELLLFDQAVDMNRATFEKRCECLPGYFKMISSSLISKYNHILLYGAGKRGKCLYKAIEELLGENAISKVEYLVSTKDEAQNKNCLCWENLDYDRNTTLVLLSANSDAIKGKLSESTWSWFDISDDIWEILEYVYD